MDLSTLAAPVATVVVALIGLLAARRRETRLRNGIQASIESIEKLIAFKTDGGNVLVGKFEEVLSVQISSLLELETLHSREKQRNWPSLAAAILMAAVFSTPLWFMWKPQSPFVWVGFVALAAINLLIVMSGILAWAKGPVEKKGKVQEG